MADLTRLSKFLALVLRHRAHEFGLSLDAEGFADIETVWGLVDHRYPGRYLLTDLQAVVEGDKHGKKRYEIREGQIRAMYGHGKHVGQITYSPAEPPETLYHGTTATAAPIRPPHPERQAGESRCNTSSGTNSLTQYTSARSASGRHRLL